MTRVEMNKWEEREAPVKVNSVNGIDANLSGMSGFPKGCAVRLKIQGKWCEGTLLGCNDRLDSGIFAFVTLDNGDVYRTMFGKVWRSE